MSGGLLTTFHKALYALTSLPFPARPLPLRRPAGGKIVHREVGAGLVETSISVGLVGTMVISSVILFGGEITHQFNYRVLPGIQNSSSAATGEGPAQNDSDSGPLTENYSSAQSSQPNDSVELKPIAYGGAAQPAGSEEIFGDNSEVTSGASEGSSSSATPGDAGYDWSRFDWNTVDWDWAVVAGIVSHPDPDDVGQNSLNESDYQSSSSTDWNLAPELSLGFWCTSQGGTYFSTEPCPDLMADWDAPVAGGLAPPVISWCQDENGNPYMQENAPCS